jgi:hypothetical protein
VQAKDAASSALQVLYTILSYSATLDNADLAALLQSAVASGAFDTLLQQHAAAEGATGLLGATSQGVEVNDLSGTPGDGSGDDDHDGSAHSDGSGSSSSADALSQGALIGIIAGGGLAVVLCLVGLAYACWPKAVSATTPAVAAAPAAQAAGATSAAATAPSAPPAGVEMSMSKGMASELDGMGVTTYPVRGLPVGAAVPAAHAVASAPAQVILLAENVTLV